MANENATAKNGANENALSWLYDITIGSIREFVNMQSLKNTVKNAYEKERENSFENMPTESTNYTNVDVGTQAKMWAFEQILLDGKKGRKPPPSSYAKLFFKKYGKWNQERPTSKKLRSNDVELMETAIGMLLREKEFSGLSLSSKVKAMGFWYNAKNYKFPSNNTREFADAAVQLFNMCYSGTTSLLAPNDKSKMQLFHDVIDVWTTGTVSRFKDKKYENERADLIARANAIKTAITKKEEINPLLLESNVSTSIALAFEENLGKLGYGKFKQDALKNAVKYFGNSREKCNSFKSLYDSFYSPSDKKHPGGKCPNEALGEQLQKILVSRVVSGKRKQSLDGLKTFASLMRVHKELFNPSSDYTKTLLWYMNAEKLAGNAKTKDIKKIYVFNSPSMIRHAFEMTDVAKYSEDLLKEACKIANPKTREGYITQIRTARQNFLCPQYDPDTFVPVITRQNNYLLMADSENATRTSVGQAPLYYAIDDKKEHYTAKNSKGEVTDLFTQEEIKRHFGAKNLGLITQGDFEWLEKGLPLTVVSKPKGGYECRFFPPYSNDNGKRAQAKVSIDGKNEGIYSYEEFAEKYACTQRIKRFMQRQPQSACDYDETQNTLKNLSSEITTELKKQRKTGQGQPNSQSQQRTQEQNSGQNRQEQSGQNRQFNSHSGNSGVRLGSPSGYNSSGNYDDYIPEAPPEGYDDGSYDVFNANGVGVTPGAVPNTSKSKTGQGQNKRPNNSQPTRKNANRNSGNGGNSRKGR